MSPVAALDLSALGLEVVRPLALWGLALALPLTVFHLYHRRRVKLVVPFLPLLLESTGPARRDARFKRLRDALALLLRLLALACVVLALAGLRPVHAEQPPEDLFLVIDADVTTATREADGTPRLGRALAFAERWIRAQPGGGEQGGDLLASVSVLLARRTPELLVPPTQDRPHALERLARSVRPEVAGADLDGALRMAIDGARARPRARVVVLSARAVAPVEVPANVRLDVVGVGVARDDQGIVDIHVERPGDDPVYRVRLRTESEAAAARTRVLEVRIDDVVVAREEVRWAGSEPVELSFSLPAPAAPAWLEARLVGEDVFPLNDRVHARLMPTTQPSVLVVHDGAVRPYTAAVLHALVAGGFIDGERSGYVLATDLARAEPRDVVLVDGVALPPAALTPGAYIFLAPLAGALPFDLGAGVDDPLVWRTESNHPLMRDLDLQRAFVLRGRTLTGTGLRPLAFAEGRPVIGEGERDGVRYVALGLDPEGSALPGQTALPDFVRRAILRLARAPVAPLAPLYRRGDVVRPELPLPGGPEATIAWEGPTHDPLLQGAGRARGRFAPEGDSWRVPPGATGRAHVTTTSGRPPWTGHTALFDAAPGRRIQPVRPEGLPPRAALVRLESATRWRRGLLLGGLLLLLIDLLALSRGGLRRTARQP